MEYAQSHREIAGRDILRPDELVAFESPPECPATSRFTLTDTLS
jgi:hypothetical protein